MSKFVVCVSPSEVTEYEWGNLVCANGNDAEEIIIGRSIASDILLVDSFISRYHCTVTRTELFEFRLCDGLLMGKPSTHGTWVNGVRVRAIILKDGDKITFCDRVPYPHIIFKEQQELVSCPTLGHEFEE